MVVERGRPSRRFVDVPEGLLPHVPDSSPGRKTRDDADAGVDGDVDAGVDADGKVIFGRDGRCECRWETDGLSIKMVAGTGAGNFATALANGELTRF